MKLVFFVYDHFLDHSSSSKHKIDQQVMTSFIIIIIIIVIQNKNKKKNKNLS